MSAAGQTIKGEGDEKLSGATLQAGDISEEIGPDLTLRLRLIIIDRTTYAQLPAELNPAGKPWVRLTPDSSNPTIRTMATLIESVRNSASLDQSTTFTSAARRVTLVGKESLDAVPVTHYSIEVDVAKLPSTTPGRQTLLGAGVTTLPVELSVDDEGRPVKLTQDVTVQGQSASTVITLSRFNAPVSISAPPPDQVATS
ncbi:MAG: hypothetical protein ACRDRI_12195 [Pseudonocardiaceae bacterium]